MVLIGPQPTTADGPAKAWSGLPVMTSQICTLPVLSYEAMRLLSGDHVSPPRVSEEVITCISWMAFMALTRNVTPVPMVANPTKPARLITPIARRVSLGPFTCGVVITMDFLPELTFFDLQGEKRVCIYL
jgi:hypothetical protein